MTHEHLATCLAAVNDPEASETDKRLGFSFGQLFTLLQTDGPAIIAALQAAGKDVAPLVPIIQAIVTAFAS